jgi:hypothetical protein
VRREGQEARTNSRRNVRSKIEREREREKERKREDRGGRGEGGREGPPAIGPVSGARRDSAAVSTRPLNEQQTEGRGE